MLPQALKKKATQMLHSFKKGDKQAKKKVQEEIKRLEGQLLECAETGISIELLEQRI
jgi:hypothetical protein